MMREHSSYMEKEHYIRSAKRTLYAVAQTIIRCCFPAGWQIGIVCCSLGVVHEPGSGNGAKMRRENKDDASEMGHRLLEIVVVHGKSVAISLKKQKALFQ